MIRSLTIDSFINRINGNRSFLKAKIPSDVGVFNLSPKNGDSGYEIAIEKWGISGKVHDSSNKYYGKVLDSVTIYFKNQVLLDNYYTFNRLIVKPDSSNSFIK